MVTSGGGADGRDRRTLELGAMRNGAFGGTLFSERFGLTQSSLERLLDIALGRGGDFADLYLEYRAREFLSLEEGILKNPSRNVTQGVGIRVVCDGRTGYAYSEAFEPEEMEKAALTASAIASSAGGVSVQPVGFRAGSKHDLYHAALPPLEFDLSSKIALLEEADQIARAYDPRIVEVRAVLSAERKDILILNSRGNTVWDVQPLLVFQVSCIASSNGRTQMGIRGGGGRVGLEFLESSPPGHFSREAARQAILLLGAREAPAGPMNVVLGPGWPGILLHEAVGHGLESDFNRKGLSAFSGRLGEKVASPLCTVIDDGTIPGRRGSLNVDDEGTPTGRTVLIERGVLRAYMQDGMNALLTGASPTGNGRRESYAFMPIPRMTNTLMLAGESSPEEIVRSVRRGLYAVRFGGGQVDITNGKFVFSASEAYLIEEGRITAPVRGATLIGSGPEVLKRVSMVGHDLQMDEGVGTCGKDGQSVPVGVGMPTVRVDEITVGGTTN